MSNSRVIRELLSRKDPQGYYVIPCKLDILRFLEKHNIESIVVEEIGDIVLLRIKSRRVAEYLAFIALKQGLLAV